MDVVSEGAVRRTEGAGILLQPRQRVAPTRARGGRDSEAGGEQLRSLLESLGTEELAPEGSASLLPLSPEQ